MGSAAQPLDKWNGLPCSENEKYKGTYVGAKFIMPVPCKHRVLRAPLEQQVRIEDSHATIVTPEEFEQAQIQNRNFRLL